MYADFPFLNNFFGALFSDPRDKSPTAFLVLYTNMNIASMYLLAVCIAFFLWIVALLIKFSCEFKHNERMNAIFVLLYNFFVFGLVFAGCASLQGAIIN